MDAGEDGTLGWRQGRLFVECLVEKTRPAVKTMGEVIGMDSNYKHGLVFSDGQTTGDTSYRAIQDFAKRQTHTHVLGLVGIYGFRSLQTSHLV